MVDYNHAKVIADQLVIEHIGSLSHPVVRLWLRMRDQGAPAGVSPPPTVIAGTAGASWSRPFIW